MIRLQKLEKEMELVASENKSVKDEIKFLKEKLQLSEKENNERKKDFLELKKTIEKGGKKKSTETKNHNRLVLVHRVFN